MKIRKDGEAWYDTFMTTTLGLIILVLLGTYVCLALAWWPLFVGVPVALLVAYGIGRFAEHRWMN